MKIIDVNEIEYTLDEDDFIVEVEYGKKIALTMRAHNSGMLTHIIVEDNETNNIIIGTQIKKQDAGF